MSSSAANLEMQRKMAAIGVRYLLRTVSEVQDLEALASKFATASRSEAQSVLKDIEILAHRIRGSGAVFGYVAMSDAAGEIEMLAVRSQQAEQYNVQQVTAQFAKFVGELSAQTQSALRQAEATAS